MPTEGKRNQKFTYRRLVPWQKAQLGMPADCLNIASQFLLDDVIPQFAVSFLLVWFCFFCISVLLLLFFLEASLKWIHPGLYQDQQLTASTGSQSSFLLGVLNAQFDGVFLSVYLSVCLSVYYLLFVLLFWLALYLIKSLKTR